MKKKARGRRQRPVISYRSSVTSEVIPVDIAGRITVLLAFLSLFAGGVLILKRQKFSEIHSDPVHQGKGQAPFSCKHFAGLRLTLTV